MLTRFEVKGFKSLVDVAIDLGAVNVFIGANGSGKSNLLEAVGFLSAMLSAAKDAEAFRYRSVRLGSSISYLCSINDIAANRLEFKLKYNGSYYSSILKPNSQRVQDWSYIDETLSHNNYPLFKKSDLTPQNTHWPA